MLMHARSATVLAGPPALNPRSLHLPPPLPPSPSFFVYLAKFDSPTRSDLTSPIASYPSRLSSLSCSPSCHRGFLCWYLASSLVFLGLNSVSPSLFRISLLPDHHRRWVFLSTPRSASPLVDSARIDPLN